MGYTATTDGEASAAITLMIGWVPVAEDDEDADACADDDNAEDDDYGDECWNVGVVGILRVIRTSSRVLTSF